MVVLAFVLVTIANLISVTAPTHWLELASKPVLVPLLVLYVLVAARRAGRPAALVAGLLFGWAGDIALLFDHTAAFLIGLALFLLGHICYLVGYVRLGALGALRHRWWPVVGYTVAWAVLLTVLWGRLGAMRIPMTVYGLVLFAMAALALTRDWRLGLGAFLFAASDVAIAASTLGVHIPQSGLLVMATYIAGQLVIALSWLRLRATDHTPS